MTMKMCYTHIIEYYVAVRKDKIAQFAATWLEWEDMLREVSQKDKHKMISLISNIENN